MSSGKHRAEYNKRGEDALQQLLLDSLNRMEGKLDVIEGNQGKMTLTLAERKHEEKKINLKIEDHLKWHKKKSKNGRISKIIGLPKQSLQGLLAVLLSIIGMK